MQLDLFFTVLIIGLMWWPLSLLFIANKSRATNALKITFFVQITFNIIWFAVTAYCKASFPDDFFTINQILLAVIALTDTVIFILNTVLFIVASMINKHVKQESLGTS